MSREIKFRGWDKYDKKMIYDLCQVDSFWHYYSYSDNMGLHFGKTGPSGVGEDFENKYIMQYTGLKDKNGKEIYEGDIIQLNKKEFGDRKAPVIFDKERFCYAIKSDKQFDTFRTLKECCLKYNLNFSEMIEVIGNIYENPELLEEKQ